MSTTLESEAPVPCLTVLETPEACDHAASRAFKVQLSIEVILGVYIGRSSEGERVGSELIPYITDIIYIKKATN